MLEHLFGSKTRLKLLQLFISNPNKSFYVRELARMIGVQMNAVRREISNLEAAGLVMKMSPSPNDGEASERCKYYRLDMSSMLYPEFKELLIKVQIIEEREFVEQLKKRAGKITFLLLTGQFTEAKNSESDMLIVGEVKAAVVAKIVREFEKTIGHELRYTIMSTDEFNDRRELGDKFLYGLFEGKNVIAINEVMVNN
ncbi:MAG: winged helix-turn-helix domain-containing protein [Patescibacteria group bacterium]